MSDSSPDKGAQGFEWGALWGDAKKNLWRGTLRFLDRLGYWILGASLFLPCCCIWGELIHRDLSSADIRRGVYLKDECRFYPMRRVNELDFGTWQVRKALRGGQVVSSDGVSCVMSIENHVVRRSEFCRSPLSAGVDGCPEPFQTLFEDVR